MRPLVTCSREIDRLRMEARYRAWQAHSADFSGKIVVLPHGELRIELSCHRCPVKTWDDDECYYTLWQVESAAILYAQENGCHHLDVLLEEDPPEVAALAALELIAGG